MEINSCEFEGLVSFEEINSYKLAKEVKHHGKVFIKYEECEDRKKLKLRKKKTKKFSPKTGFSTNKSDYSRRTLLKNSTVKDENTAKRKCDEKHEESPISTKKLALEIDVESWKAIFTPDVVIEAIKELGFREPSAIQKLTIPAAIKGRKDIVGAAETGSGKTLAFVIPIIHGILKEREKDTFGNKNEHLNGENDSEEETNYEFGTESNSSDNEENFEENVEEERETGCVKVINDIHFDFQADENHNANVASKKKLRALIVTPTRELAVQIKKHADAVLSKTDIKSAVVIGGLSREKQERILSRGPEIVIGTPGRLWELVQQGNSHLIQLPEIRFFAVDETDRMLEKGHFEELQHLLEMINGDTESKRRRQNFVFSATLTLTHGPPRRLSAKKKVIKLTSEMKIENLMKLIGVREKPKIVDITRKFGTAEMLSEAKIFCDRDEKDSYLYYFLNRFPGRTLIFCNSINCVRRLSNLLTLLQCKPRALHASKQQKQRLKSLERFASDRTSVLLATDVAARGIDIPDVDHIVHYEVPRTAETYIHRSGRTARANQEGLSVILVDSIEVGKYRQLCGTLNRSSDLPSFPVNEEMLDGVKGRVELAREIEKMQHGTKKRSTDDAWLQKMAEEAGIELGGSSDDDDFVCELALERKRSNCELKEKKSRLAAFLSRPLTTISFSGRYPTSTGKLLLPTQSLLNHDSAAPIDLLKQQKKIKLLPKFSTVRRKKNKKLKNKRK